MRFCFVLAIVLVAVFGPLGLANVADAQSASQSRPPQASWPSTITQNGYTATVYEPQPTAWPGRTTLDATAAVIITKTGINPIVGTIDISAATTTDIAGRWVTFSNIQILDTHFPMLNTQQATNVQAKLTQVAAKMGPKRIPLDTLLLSLHETPAEMQPVAVDNTPPEIFHSTEPAILVVTDGAPVLSPVTGTGLSFVVNTNWNLFKENATGVWYLLDDKVWLSAPEFTGPYEPAGALPPDFGNLPNDASFADVKQTVPNGPAPAQPPVVFVSTKPAEIIVTNGAAQLTPVAGAPLQFVSNTDAEIIYDPASSKYFVLFSGRWFSAPSLDGPWTYATPTLPPTFALIPPDGPQAAVLPSVPGTAQAQEAVITAQIPTEATLPASTTAQVSYVGTPNFAPIAGTSMYYAVNTYSQVVEVNGAYYDCYNGAWFYAPAPTGPFVIASSVPQVIYTIPLGSPLYPVTYVRVYSATPTVIVTGYTAGYTAGLIIAAGILVYGTGFYYPPYIIPGVVPIYVPYRYTYGGGYRYVSSTGAWVSGGRVYGPYGGAASRSYYNPATGAYAHGSAVWGPNGGYAHGSFYNPATGRSGSTSQSWSPYGRSGASTITGPYQTIHTQSSSNAYGSKGSFSSSTGAAGAGVHNSVNGNNTGVVKTANGDVYAGHNGNVYEHTDSGWSQYNSGSNSFKPVTPPPATPQTGSPRPASSPGGGNDYFNQLNSDRNARQGGWQRQRENSGGFGGGGFGGGGFGGGNRRQ